MRTKQHNNAWIAQSLRATGRLLLMTLFLMLGVNVMAQKKILLHPTTNDGAKCEKSDMTSLKATFSFPVLEAQDCKNKGGEFSLLSMPNTVIGGNEGDPEIPVVNELIAVPVGATPQIRVKSFSTEDYNLADYDIKTLAPRQPSLRKDKNADAAPFVYNKAAYEKEGLSKEPRAVVEVVGTMRGIRLAKMTIEPVSYDPVKNTVRVFNDIEVEVDFDGASKKATNDLYTETYSPYFDIVYKQLFNGNATKSAYDDHPDLYKTPVKMLVVSTSTYINSAAFQNWLTWKKQKGFDVDVQTVANGASASTVKNLIYSRYNANHPTFLVIVGDETVVTNYSMWDYDSSYGNAATDLEYASVDGDVYHDMFMSRMPVSSTTELGNLVNKILTYEKYTMSDPSYLDETLLIAGWDDTWTPRVGKPTIQYANNYYFNAAHGITPHVFLTTSSGETECYNFINQVGFINYTAHGDIQKWHDPEFTNTNVNSLTNSDKYFWAMGNCCLTANFKNAQNSQVSFGETMVRAANKGAFGYIGSVPESYWYEDYYFGVGATTKLNAMPTQEQTKTGAYDALFDDTGFNTLNSVPFIGNVAVAYAHANSYTSSVSDEYYWRAYQCFGDGSVMPYLKQPAANNVSHANVIFIGATSFTVNADAKSYVAITKNNQILGVGVVPANGTSVDVPIEGLTEGGEVMIVVTRNQRQPYITTIQAIAPDGPYINLDSYTPTMALVGESTDLSLTFRNIGTSATSGPTTVTLTSNDANVTIDGNGSFNALDADATATVSGFSFTINPGATLGDPVSLHYTAVNASNTWEGDFTIIPNQRFTVNVAANDSSYGTVSGGNSFDYNTSCTVTATPADGYMFTGWTLNGNVVSTNPEYTFNVTSDMNLVANFAAGVMIGSGTTTNEYLPTYNYYKYSLSEQIYTSAELGGAGIITSIAFYNGGTAKTRTLEFYMKATTKSSFSGTSDWIAVSSGDKVFSGSVTMVANDWTTITLSSPFVYDGTSNVVLVTDDNTGAYTSSPHMTCRVFSTSSNQAHYCYDDSNNFNPLSPSASSGSNNSTLSVKNQIILSKAPLPTGQFNITVSADPSQGGTVSGGGEYQFGEACTVTVTPNPGYTFTGWTENGVVVSTESTYIFSAVADRNLVATFIQAIEIGQATSTNNYLPSYSYYKYSMTEQIYTADEIGMAGAIKGIAFYNEGAEKTRTYDFYLKSTTKSSFSSKTDWVTVAASDKVFSGSVTMAANAWTYITFTTPFEYDGISNIVLVADDNSGEWSDSPHMACSVFSTSQSQAIYIYNDNTNYNPASPTTSQSSNYATLQVKNHIRLSIEGGASPYPVPTDLSISNITSRSAVVSWEGEADNYELQYVEEKMETLTFDFEDGSQGWTVLKGTEGTSTHNWMHNTAYVAYDSNGAQIVPECHNSSSGMMLSESYISAATAGGSGSAVTPDNYLVSPRIQLGGTFSFYAASRMSNYPAEKFSVLVSETGNSISDFTHTELTVTLSNNSWKEYTVDLSAYSGMGYVAIRHYDCYDQHLLYIDDVTIEGKSSDWVTVSNATSPCTLTNLTPGTPYLTRVRGLYGANDVSDWSNNVSFTTKDYVTLELANGANNTDVIDTNSGEEATVTLTGRTLYKDNAWNTLCLPFDVTVSESPLEGAIVKELDTTTSNLNGSTLTLNFTDVTDIEAGKPYIIKWESGDDIVNPVFTGVTIKKELIPAEVTDVVSFIGNYDPVPLTAGDQSILYIGAGNQLYYPNANFALNAFRAYFKMDDKTKRVKAFVMSFDEDFATGIVSLLGETEEGAVIYNLAGQRLNKTRQGINIVNGKKVLK